jgi:hypothetical protein
VKIIINKKKIIIIIGPTYIPTYNNRLLYAKVLMQLQKLCFKIRIPFLPVEFAFFSFLYGQYKPWSNVPRGTKNKHFYLVYWSSTGFLVFTKFCHFVDFNYIVLQYFKNDLLQIKYLKKKKKKKKIKIIVNFF